jgi:RNA recognition motif-containing protein
LDFGPSFLMGTMLRYIILVDTEGLRQYMLRFGELDDVIVMKDRATGRSRGFGYVTFSSAENAQKAVSTQHSLNGRMLEVKIATPRVMLFFFTLLVSSLGAIFVFWLVYLSIPTVRT